MSLTFNDRGKWHDYWLDGARVPSVTTLLNGGTPKPALMPWAARTGGEAVRDFLFGDDEEPTALILERLRKAGPSMIVDLAAGAHRARSSEAKVKGTDVHELAERVLREDVQPPEALAGYVEGYVAFLARAGVEVELAERVVGSRAHRYAGKFDLIGRMSGERWGLDLKTGGAIYDEVPCQVAAYVSAEFYVDEDGHEVPLPEVDRIGALHVTEFGTELVDLGPIREAFEDFLAIKRVAQSTKRRKAIVEAAPVTIVDTSRALF